MGAKVIVGVTGSIAAYKSCTLVSQLTQAGIAVRVVMTPEATRFVSALTFETLSRAPVVQDMFEAPQQWKPDHIELAEDAQLMVVAPATANAIAKIALSLADDPVCTTVLAADCPLWVAPAMNPTMFQNKGLQKHLQSLKDDGVRLLEPSEGEMACGHTGLGKMAEPEDILQEIKTHLGQAV